MTGGPRFRHLDELPWQEVRRQQQGDRIASVKEKWLEFSPRYLSLYARWDPGMIVQAHGHNSDHIVFVLEGSMTCGGVDVRVPRTRARPAEHAHSPEHADSMAHARDVPTRRVRGRGSA